MAAKLVLALAMGATALLAPTNKLPVNTVRRAASTAPEMVVKVGVIGAGRIGLVHLEALRVAVSFLSLDAVGGSRTDGVMVFSSFCQLLRRSKRSHIAQCPVVRR